MKSFTQKRLKIQKLWQIIGFNKIVNILEKSFCLKSSDGTKNLVFSSELKCFPYNGFYGDGSPASQKGSDIRGFQIWETPDLEENTAVKDFYANYCSTSYSLWGQASKGWH